MLDTKKLRHMLAAEGIQVNSFETTKNGVVCTGFTIQTDGPVKPIVYYSKEDTTEILFKKIQSASQNKIPAIKTELLFSRDYLKSNVRLAIQRMGNENIVKKNYLDTEIFVKLHSSILDDSLLWTIKLNESILSEANVTEEEVFDWAIQNTRRILTIDTLNSLLGLPEEIGKPMFYVARTTDNHDGGIALAYPELFQKFCLAKKLPSCLILPSSTQEILILEELGFENPVSLAEMIEEVNKSHVSPTLRMNPTVYRYSLKTNIVHIATALS